MTAAQLQQHWDLQLVRGCMVCQHGTGPEGHRLCAHPEVAGRAGAPVPVHVARANHGACGPEARHMYFAGLYAA